MAKKPVLTAAEAAKMIPDGATIMCGGFLACGQARAIVKELVKLGTKDLTLIANDMGRATGPKGEEFFGIAELIHNHQVKRVIATHVGMTPEVGQQNTEGTLEVNLLPQGTLAECIRAGGAGLGGGNDEREQTLNQLLVEMDGFEPNENVILIAATNRPDVLDPALLRPGRFDRQVTVTNPDIKGREDILKVHTRKVPLAKDVNLSVIARGTPGFSGADLANLVNEAALLAARKNKNKVTSKDFDDAKDKVLMGNERRSMAMDEAEKKLTAYHEAGHAICSLFVPDTDPIHKATIIPRGRALGMVQQLPEKDQYSYSRSKMLSRLIILMGGRVAEELKFGYDKVTSGASSDIAAATNLARSMVTEWGMSDKLGPVLYAENSGEVFLGKSVTQNKNMSEDTARLVDAEIKRLVTESFEGAQKLLKEKNKEWETLAQALMEYETLTGDEIKQVLAGEKVDKSKECPVCEEKRTHASIPEI